MAQWQAGNGRCDYLDFRKIFSSGLKDERLKIFTQKFNFQKYENYLVYKGKKQNYKYQICTVCLTIRTLKRSIQSSSAACRSYELRITGKVEGQVSLL